jgi:Fur family zinc uptake transcriptional regulator
MLRRSSHDHDLAKGGIPDYMGRMIAKLEIRPHERTGSCCAAHAAPAVETLAAAEALCRQRGVRLTPQRRAVLAALAEAKRPLGAYALIETMRGDNGRAPAPIAIYRALDFLRENGFIHRLETLNAFVACPHRHDSGARIVFLICDQCRHVEEAVADGLNRALAALAKAHGFIADRQVVEIAGRCRNCAGAARG